MQNIGWCLHGDGELSVWLDGDTDNATEIQITKAVAYLARSDGLDDIYQLRGVLTACLAILDDAISIAEPNNELYGPAYLPLQDDSQPDHSTTHQVGSLALMFS